MHNPQALKFLDFDSKENPLTEFQNSQQGKYLVNYLKDLEAKKILLEPNYFDRDYLSEFSAFYSTSVYGYKNICKRVHFFSNENIDRELFENAVGGDKDSIETLNNNYLGFCVLRPIHACLGRTVLKWYKKSEQYSQRVTVKREYKCHVAGVKLKIEGLAWQQQDSGVGACATIALWSALQSSAFDDFHAIPTTAEITKVANKTASLGSRTFPSKGLTSFQLKEAIKELGLSPMVQTGNDDQKYFTKERFMSSIASYIRSGYPVIILGNLIQDDQYIGDHAVCTVGFRDRFDPMALSKTITLEDSLSEILYIHDDNIGPNTRFRIKTQQSSSCSIFNKIKQQNKNINFPILHLEAPKYSQFKEDYSYQIIPRTLVVATHNELRASPDQLYDMGFWNVAVQLHQIFKSSGNPIQLSLSTRFIKLTDYVHNELGRLEKNPKNLSQLRLNLWENVRPMSLHLGLVRIGLAKSSTPLLDVLYDTTDSQLQFFTYIPFTDSIDKIVKNFQFNFGRTVSN